MLKRTHVDPQAIIRYHDEARQREEAARQRAAIRAALLQGTLERLTQVASERRLIHPKECVTEAGVQIRVVNTLERLIGRNDLMPTAFLHRAIACCRPVGRVVAVGLEGQGFGTGFMVSPRLMLTNHHVLPDALTAGNSTIEFFYELGADGRLGRVQRYQLQPHVFFAHDRDLDYALVAVSETELTGGAPLADIGFLRLSTEPRELNDLLNILQHPDGQPKHVALRDNQVVTVTESVYQYETDTQPGSSGSPVFDDEWRVVALHHSGVPSMDASGNLLRQDGSIWQPDMPESQIHWVANEGIRMGAILDHLQASATGDRQRALLDELLARVGQEPVFPGLIEAGAPSGSATEEEKTYYDPEQDARARDAYYAGLEREAARTQLFDALSALLRDTHRDTPRYKPAAELYPLIDKHPDGMLRSIYSGKQFTAEELIRRDQEIDRKRAAVLQEVVRKEGFNPDALAQAIEALEAQHPYNCEHVVPQSWFGRREPMRGDLHHLFACEVGCNSFRGNLPYTDFPNYPATEEAIRNLCGKSERGDFEPLRGKGPVARATLYFLLRYPGTIRQYSAERIRTLVAWHEADPPGPYELHRNAAIAARQGNRNPLIDHPEMARDIDFSRGLR